MPKIIKATQYGFRTVFLVCLNPTEPEWVHGVGESVRDLTGLPVVVPPLIPGGPSNRMLVTSRDAPVAHTGDTEQAKQPGRVLCHNCHYNWRVQEIVFDGPQQFVETNDGSRPKTIDEFLAEVAQQVNPGPRPLTLVQAEGTMV